MPWIETEEDAEFMGFIKSFGTQQRPQILALLEKHMPEIRERFGIETLGIFGSVARGEDTPESDVDILYLFQENSGSMNTIIPLMHYLENLFGRQVDLVSLNFVSPLIETQVKADAILCNAGEAPA
jgi:predicted nucleotidyltransferase